MSYPSGTLLLVQVQDAIYDWVNKQLVGVVDPEAIIWRDQSKTLPQRPMVSLKIIDGPRAVGRNASLSNASEKRFNLGMQHVLTLSVQAFGSSAVQRPLAAQIIADLHASLTKLSVLDQFRRVKIAVQDIGAPRNLTELEETEYEDRAGFDVQMGVAQNVIDDPSTIETVNGQGEVNGKDVPFTVTVP